MRSLKNVDTMLAHAAGCNEFKGDQWGLLLRLNGTAFG